MNLIKYESCDMFADVNLLFFKLLNILGAIEFRYCVYVYVYVFVLQNFGPLNKV